MKEREEKKKKERNRQKAKKAKKRAASSSSDSETGSNSDTNSEPKKEKKHHASKLQAKYGRTTCALKACLGHSHSYHSDAAANDAIFIAHLDSGTLNHMCHKMNMFDPSSFKTLPKPILISLGDDSEIFATRKGTICLMFNVDGRKREGKFSNILFILDLKVTLLSVGQSTQLPHCKVVFNRNVCKYIDKTQME